MSANVTFTSAEDTDFRVNAIDDLSSLSTDDTPSESSDDEFIEGLHTSAPPLVPDSVQLLSGNQFRRLLQDSERPAAARRGPPRKGAKPARQRQGRGYGQPPSGGALKAVRSIGGLDAEDLHQQLLAAKKEARALADELRKAKKRNVQLDESRRRDTREADSLALALSSTSKSTQVKGLLQDNAHMQRRIAGLIEDNTKKTREAESLALQLHSASPTSGMVASLRSRGSPRAGSPGGLTSVDDGTQVESLQKMLHAATREANALRAERDRHLTSAGRQADENYCRFVMMKLAFAARTRKLAQAEEGLRAAETRCEDLAARERDCQRSAGEAERTWAARVDREKARAASVEGLLRIAQRAADGRTEGSSAWGQMVASFEVERDDLHRQIRDLEGRLAASHQGVAKASRTEDAIRSQTAALFKEEIVARDHEILRLERELANTASATKNASADAELSKQKASRLLEHSEVSASHKLEAHGKVVDRLKAEVKSLKQKLAAANEANRDLTRQLASQGAKIDSLREAQQQQRLRSRNARVDDEDDENY
ncbi:hypothetical protein DIPPA_07081 [Diplonema papillatum]|nr:hypothetical protein DIPPA_07081 [Diplonema papillatum]